MKRIYRIAVAEPDGSPECALDDSALCACICSTMETLPNQFSIRCLVRIHFCGIIQRR